MKRYAVTVTEIHDEDPPGSYWGPLRLKYHREEEILKMMLAEEKFDLRLLLRAILKGVEENNE